MLVLLLLGCNPHSPSLILTISWSLESPSEVILDSLGCCNKIPHSGWLKTIQMYSLTILEFKNPKSVSLGQSQGISRPAFLLEAVKEILFLWPFQLEVIILMACSPFLHLQMTCFQSLIPLSSILSPLNLIPCDCNRFTWSWQPRITSSFQHS